MSESKETKPEPEPSPEEKRPKAPRPRMGRLIAAMLILSAQKVGAYPKEDE